MNKAQQKLVDNAETCLAEAIAELETVRDQLQEAFDEKSEKWQEGEAGEEMQQKIAQMEEAIEAITEAKDNLPTEAE